MSQPIASVCRGKQLTLSAALAKLTMGKRWIAVPVRGGTVELWQCDQGSFVEARRSPRIGAANAVKALGLKDGDQLILTTTTTLPAGLTTSTRYYVRDPEPNRFKLSLSPNGSLIDVTDTGTGTHSYYVVGSVQYTFLAGGNDTVGRYAAWFTLTSTTVQTVPVSRTGLIVEILALGN